MKDYILLDDAPARVLVVDDTRLNQKILQSALEGDYDVAIATNSLSAFKEIEKCKPDLILLDIVMPGLDGYEVCRILKEDKSKADIPIIFITGLTDVKAKSRGFEAGAVDYITKPFEILEVKARVHNHICMQRNMKNLKMAHDALDEQRRRMQMELDLGKKIQSDMLPTIYPKNDKFDISAFLKPAKELGGDFYDFFFIDDDHLCFCVGDVSGKGVPAALFMAVTKTLIKSYAHGELSPASILSSVNRELSTDNQLMMFVSLFIGILCVSDGVLSFSNGGHNAPFLVKNDLSVIELSERHGMVLGYARDYAYKSGRVKFSAGDSLVLYSDGVTEAVDAEGEMYGEERLSQSLSKEVPSAKVIVDNILSCLDGFVGDEAQADDITVLALRYGSN